MRRLSLLAATLLAWAGCSRSDEGEPAAERAREESSAPTAARHDESPLPQPGPTAPDEGDEPDPGRPTAYDAIPEESSLYVIVRRDPEALGSRLSHDHVVHATGWSGTIEYSPDHPASCSVEIEVQVADLVADDAAMRETAGLSGTLSRGDRREIDANMRAEGQLHSEAHPAIRFASTTVSKEGDRLLVGGELTIRGRSREIEVPVEVSVADGVLTARGGFEATHADFGFEPYSALMGALRNGQTLEFAFEVRAKTR